MPKLVKNDRVHSNALGRRVEAELIVNRFVPIIRKARKFTRLEAKGWNRH